MKKKIIKMLKNNFQDFVSGEEICQILGVSRTSVWKHIKALKEEGYQIQSLPKLGYKLMAKPDLLNSIEIKNGLQTISIGHKIYYFRQATSTNDLAKALAQQGEPEGTIVVAEEQVSGRGRLGRNWLSPAYKGIWLTIILRPHILPVDAHKITMAAAVSVHNTFLKLFNVNTDIKWPNDILLEGKKLVGILTEMNGEMDRINFIVVGIGINVNFSDQDIPENLKKQVTSLKIFLQQEVERVSLLQTLLAEFEQTYLLLINNQFEPVWNQWKQNCVTLGSNVTVTGYAGNFWQGKALDINQHGALLVESINGEVIEVNSGEVTLNSTR